MFSQEQFTQLLAALKGMGPQQYTITGAADWPMLLVIGGMLVGAVAMMWADLRSKLSTHQTDLRAELADLKTTNAKEHDDMKKANTKSNDDIWAAMRDCQDDCCPRKRTEIRN